MKKHTYEYHDDGPLGIPTLYADGVPVLKMANAVDGDRKETVELIEHIVKFLNCKDKVLFDSETTKNLEKTISDLEIEKRNLESSLETMIEKLEDFENIFYKL